MPNIGLNIEALEDLPEFAREFATKGEDGKFSLDFDKSFAALKAERDGHRADRQELAAFKALGANADALKKFVELGKTPEEIAALVAESANRHDDDSDAADKLSKAEKEKLTAEKNYKTLKAEFDKIKARIEESDRLAADAKLRSGIEGLISQLPAECDKDKVRLWALGGKTADGMEVKGVYNSLYRLNALGDVDKVGETDPLEHLAAMSKSLGFVSKSTSGIAKPGNTTISGGNGINAAYQTAKDKGDITSMIANAPTEKI